MRYATWRLGDVVDRWIRLVRQVRAEMPDYSSAGCSTLVSRPHLGHSQAINPGSCTTGAMLTISLISDLHRGQGGGSARFVRSNSGTVTPPVDTGILGFGVGTPLPSLTPHGKVCCVGVEL